MKPLSKIKPFELFLVVMILIVIVWFVIDYRRTDMKALEQKLTTRQSSAPH